MELKYCERCGGLLLRRAGSPAVYCRACSRQLAEFPAPAVDRRPPARARLDAPRLTVVGGNAVPKGGAQ